MVRYPPGHLLRLIGTMRTNAFSPSFAGQLSVLRRLGRKAAVASRNRGALSQNEITEDYPRSVGRGLMGGRLRPTAFVKGFETICNVCTHSNRRSYMLACRRMRGFSERDGVL
jgi:hypothetical protein